MLTQSGASSCDGDFKSNPVKFLKGYGGFKSNPIKITRVDFKFQKVVREGASR